MDESFKKQLEDNGVDVEATLKRFMGREAIFMKFILKFADDQSCTGIRESLDNQDAKAAFEHAHSLKGVSGNLGISSIYDLAAQISDLLRGKSIEEVSMDQVLELQEQLEKTFGSFRSLIQNYQQ